VTIVSPINNITAALTCMGVLLTPMTVYGSDAADEYVRRTALIHFLWNSDSIVQKLTKIGHPSEAANRIAQEISHDVGACVVDAILIQTRAQSLDPKPYLEFFSTDGARPDVAKYLQEIDLRALAERWKPCISGAHIQRGIQTE